MSIVDPQNTFEQIELGKGNESFQELPEQGSLRTNEDSSVSIHISKENSDENGTRQTDEVDGAHIKDANCCQSSSSNSQNIIDEDIFESLAEEVEVGGTNNPKGRRCRENSPLRNYASHKNTAEGLMDIALLSANANQLRFLLTYNHLASTFYVSLFLLAVSLIMQVAVGIALIFRFRLKSCRDKRYTRTNEFLIVGVFLITVVNVLLAAFTTTDGSK